MDAKMKEELLKIALAMRKAGQGERRQEVVEETGAQNAAKAQAPKRKRGQK